MILLLIISCSKQKIVNTENNMKVIVYGNGRNVSIPSDIKKIVAIDKAFLLKY